MAKKHGEGRTGKPRYKIGILLFSLVQREGRTEWVAYLQRRGTTNFHTNQSQTWQNVCQATAEGKANPPEVPLYALQREITEELGETAGNIINARLYNYGPLKEWTLYEDEHLATIGMFVSQALIPLIRLESISGGLVEVREQDISSLIAARPEYRTKLHNRRGIVVMPHVKEALESGFKKARKYQEALNDRRPDPMP